MDSTVSAMTVLSYGYIFFGVVHHIGSHPYWDLALSKNVQTEILFVKEESLWR